MKLGQFERGIIYAMSCLNEVYGDRSKAVDILGTAGITENNYFEIEEVNEAEFRNLEMIFN